MATSRTVHKFGGSSVISADAILHIRDNVFKGDLDGEIIVVSAPAGVTNDLILAAQGTDATFNDVINKLHVRFEDMAIGLGLTELDPSPLFDEIRRTYLKLEGDAKKHFLWSRGEWLNAQIIAQAFSLPFVDSARFVRFDTAGSFDLHATRRAARKMRLRALLKRGGVISGFYGCKPDGTIWTLTRGGSDLTGIIVGDLIDASHYDNWTDVDCIAAADPRIVKDPRPNRYMTFQECRELTFMGAKVLHPDVVEIAEERGIVIHVRNTKKPDQDGTRIVPSIPLGVRRPKVTGVSGRRGFTTVTIERRGLDKMLGILWKTAKVFADKNVSINAYPDIDALTYAAESNVIAPHLDAIVATLRGRFKLKVYVENEIAFVSTVGEGMRHAVGTSAKLYKAVADAGVDVETQSQGRLQHNVTIGVKDRDMEKTIRAIHDKLCRPRTRARRSGCLKKTA